MFIGVGFAEISLLVAIFAFFLTASNSVWLVVLGSGFMLIGLGIVAPSKRNLARDQDRLRERGYSVDLIAALIGPEEPPSRPNGSGG
jgi:hypothetical protein